MLLVKKETFYTNKTAYQISRLHQMDEQLDGGRRPSSSEQD